MIIARMFNSRHMLSYVRGLTGISGYMRYASIIPLLFCASAASAACPDLQPFYLAERSALSAEEHAAAAARSERELAALMPECLLSSEFFALYGVAQMENGNLSAALESLERSLLLDPANGAAQIDYAQALYLRGQLFPALDLNDQILVRDDLPADIRTMLVARKKAWRQQTRQHGFVAEALAGYDSNLNGAPSPGQITLTLSGEPVELILSEDYRPESGPYTNLRLGGQFRQMEANHQHSVLFDVRGRVSDHTESDLLQAETRYSFVRPRRDSLWQLDAAVGNIFFGGTALYTATEAGVYYQQNRQNCRPHYSATIQHQHYHGQRDLDAVEGKASAGIDCPVAIGSTQTLLGVEASLLNNTALDSARPGGDRSGWQTRLNWQLPLYRGLLTSQLSHTRFTDAEGYNPVLEGGVERVLQRSYLLVQYRQPLNPAMAVMANFYHQYQSSNIDLFDTRDTSLEIGISLAF